MDNFDGKSAPTSRRVCATLYPQSTGTQSPSCVYIIFSVSAGSLQAAWILKARALTQQVYMDDIEADEDGIADTVMDDNSIAQVARPGTSLKTPGSQRGGTSQAFRCVPSSLRCPLFSVRPPVLRQSVHCADVMALFSFCAPMAIFLQSAGSCWAAF